MGEDMSEVDYTINLPVTLTFCPVCDEVMNGACQVEVWPEEELAAPTIDAMAEVLSMKMAEALEADIVDHYQRRHRFRYRLYMWTHWKWALG